MQELKEIFRGLDRLFENCDIDFNELNEAQINTDFFDVIQNQRIVNSFLFNYMKIQDKIGNKVFKKILFELKEIPDMSLPMKDVLNLLEKLGLIAQASDWDELREIRNSLAHEYPLDVYDKIENLHLSMKGYGLLKTIYDALKIYCQNHQCI